ncbi:MAG: alpha/beta fold hydrolase [Saprospiraceae bacterium]
MLIYLLLAVGILLLIPFLILQYYLPPLPKGANQLIAETRREPLPDFFPGRAETVDNQGVEIWYNVLEPDTPPKATVVLVMGHSATATSFVPRVWQPLLDAGYRVIRYDNRGVGLSDWMSHTGKGNRYTLEDMATDPIAILNQENIEQAHVWGISMGGMIAQRIGINYPKRVLSLTLVMTSAFMYDPKLVLTDPKWQRQLIAMVVRYGFFKDEINRSKFAILLADMLKGTGDYQTDHKNAIERSLYEWRHRRGGNPKVLRQHSAAIAKSGSRLDELSQLKMPILVMHGTHDPLVLPMHGKKLMEHLPHAKKIWIEGLGHDLPAKYVPTMIEHTLDIFAEADANKVDSY